VPRKERIRADLAFAKFSASGFRGCGPSCVELRCHPPELIEPVEEGPDNCSARSGRPSLYPGVRAPPAVARFELALAVRSSLGRKYRQTLPAWPLPGVQAIESLCGRDNSKMLGIQSRNPQFANFSSHLLERHALRNLPALDFLRAGKPFVVGLFTNY